MQAVLILVFFSLSDKRLTDSILFFVAGKSDATGPRLVFLEDSVSRLPGLGLHDCTFSVISTNVNCTYVSMTICTFC